MATRDKDIVRLMDEVAKLPGWRVEDREGGYRIFPPNGGTPMSAPHGPRRPGRALANTRAKLRRAGAKI